MTQRILLATSASLIALGLLLGVTPSGVDTSVVASPGVSLDCGSVFFHENGQWCTQARGGRATATWVLLLSGLLLGAGVLAVGRRTSVTTDSEGNS